MAHAETCPLCKGKKLNDAICNGCQDKGWVEVQDKVVSWPVYPPSPYLYPNWSCIKYINAITEMAAN